MTIKIFYGFWGLPAYIRCLKTAQKRSQNQSLIPPTLRIDLPIMFCLLMQCKIFKLKSHSGNPSSQRNEGAKKRTKSLWKRHAKFDVKLKNWKPFLSPRFESFFAIPEIYQWCISENHPSRRCCFSLLWQDHPRCGKNLEYIGSVMCKQSHGNFEI